MNLKIPGLNLNISTNNSSDLSNQIPVTETGQKQPTSSAPTPVDLNLGSPVKSPLTDEKIIKGGKPPAPKDNTPETAEKKLARGIPNVQDIIAPSAIEIDFNHVKIGEKFFRTLFVSGYPRFVGANWLEPIINFDHTSTIAMFYYPMNARNVLDDLRRKIAEMEATISMAREKGKLIDPAVQAALGDAKSLQEQLVKGIERFFHFSFYITISATTLAELNNITYQMESTLGSLSLISKKATLDMENAFKSTLPLCLDSLKVIRNMDTTSVATTFPFTSSELTANEGILYGINKHNGSLIIFDRFTLENANTVIFAKSGSGKSYFVKLEALRSLIFGVGIVVLDPETEYKRLCEAVGGDYIDFSLNTTAKINPFELSVTGEKEDSLSMKILSLHALLRIMLGDLSSAESAVLDRALIDTYRLKGITQDPSTQQNNEPPLMEDLYKVLQVMEEPESKALASRLERYVKGSLAGIFDQRSNLDLNNDFTVFSIRNLQDVLRPIAMFMILDFIWTKVKYNLKKRILLLDEAWTLMQYPDSAAFVYSLAKRSRKYYLGLTTITQDVNDFLASDYGKAVVTNSSMQVLLKQHPASIDLLSEIFYLSTGEKNFLLSAGIGEGLLFAGTNHVAMSVKASREEHMLITTNPEELMKMQKEQDISDIVNKEKLRSQVNNTALNNLSTPQAPGTKPLSIEDKYQKFDGTKDATQPPANQAQPGGMNLAGSNANGQSMPNPYSTGEDHTNDYQRGTISL
jgi:conjugal transfer ATP-binding protein TraC